MCFQSSGSREYCTTSRICDLPGWSLGCAFEKNLEEEDLLAFQVKKPVVTADDKRAWIHFFCEGERPPRATLLINPSNKIQAHILNLSPSGIGLATKRLSILACACDSN